LEQNKGGLTTIREINDALFSQYKEEKDLKLKPLDDIFCDGFLLPRTKLTNTIEQVKHRFEEQGIELVVKTVKPSMQDGYWFVKLNEDSSPDI
jgi:thermostable 8-oxoguanine DNA glycosylase